MKWSVLVHHALLVVPPIKLGWCAGRRRRRCARRQRGGVVALGICHSGHRAAFCSQPVDQFHPSISQSMVPRRQARQQPAAFDFAALPDDIVVGILGCLTLKER